MTSYRGVGQRTQVSLALLKLGSFLESVNHNESLIGFQQYDGTVLATHAVVPPAAARSGLVLEWGIKPRAKLGFRNILNSQDAMLHLDLYRFGGGTGWSSNCVKGINPINVGARAADNYPEGKTAFPAFAPQRNAATDASAESLH